MTLEAITRFSWPQAAIGNRLRQHPTAVCKLVDFKAAIDTILQSKVQVLSVEPAQIGVAVALYAEAIERFPRRELRLASFRIHLSPSLLLGDECETTSIEPWDQHSSF